MFSLCTTWTKQNLYQEPPWISVTVSSFDTRLQLLYLVVMVVLLGNY